MRKINPLAIIGPGVLVAATGVGAGDLATGAITGSKLGVAILWAVIIGSAFKYLLNEGLARWQLATGDTLLEGCAKHFGRPVQYCFLVYLLFWSFFVGSALMSACGVTAHAVVPIFRNAESDKIVYGLLHSALAVVLVRRGGYRLFGKVMSVCIGVMFVTTLATAIAMSPPLPNIVSGLIIPTVPALDSDGLQWTIGLMGGVGGTLTVLCYGYWIREEGRHSTEDLRVCRIDLATGYTMTALFGIAMVIIGSGISVDGTGAGLIVKLANQLETRLGTLGPTAKWFFLIGAWGAVFSSLLGVWQSVPYLFADTWSLLKDHNRTKHAIDPESPAYRKYLYALAILPAAGLWGNFTQVQKIYAVFGASFIPILALGLLILNGRSDFVGERYRNTRLNSLLLAAAFLFFVASSWYELQKKLFG